MAKQYRLVWSDQQGKLVVEQAHMHEPRKRFAARIVATALAATALTAFGTPEAKAQTAPDCVQTYTADKVFAANTTSSGPVCFEKNLTVEAGAVLGNDINGSLYSDIGTEVIRFATGTTTTGNLVNNGSLLAKTVGTDASSLSVINFAGGNFVGNIVNNGRIENIDSARGRAIRLFDGSFTGDIVNSSTGTIIAGYGIDISSDFLLDGSIKNDGQLAATAEISGNFALNVGGDISGSIENGLNNSGATISAFGAEAIYIEGTVSGKLVNAGTIRSDYDYAYGSLYINGTIAGGIENKATGKITTNGSAGIFMSYAANVGSIKNEGLISGENYGIYYYGSTDNSTVTNSGTLSGGTAGIYYSYSTTGALTNSGTISGGYYGLYSYSGILAGGITNQAGGLIEGTDSYGILLSSGSLSGGIRNAGKITGGYDAIYLDTVANGEDQTNIGNIVNEKGGEIIGVSGAGLYASSTAIGKIDNAGTMQGEFNGIYLSSSSVSGGILNSGTIKGTGQPTSYPYDGNGLTLTNAAIDGDIVNEASGTISGGKNGIFIVDSSTVSGALINKGIIAGGMFEGEQLDAVNDAVDALGTIVIDGNNTAQFVGAVSAYNADMSIASGATYTVRDNVFAVKSFTNNGTTIFDRAAGGASLFLADPDYGYVFQNKGTVSIAAGTTGVLTGDYAQDAAGTLLSNVGSGTIVNGVFTGDYSKLQVTGSVDLASGTTIKVNLPTSGLPKFEDGTRIESLITAGGEMNASASTIVVVDNSRRYDFFVSFDRAANELDLITIVRAAPILESVILSSKPVALGAAKVLEDLQNGDIPPAFEPVFDRLIDMETEAEIATAVSQTLPVMLGATQQSLVSGLRSTNKFIQSRMESNQGLSAGEVDGGKHLWGRAFGTWSKQDDQADVTGFKSDTQGLVLGYDGAVRPAASLTRCQTTISRWG